MAWSLLPEDLNEWSSGFEANRVQEDNLLPPSSLRPPPPGLLFLFRASSCHVPVPTRPRHTPEPQGLCYDKMSCAGLIMLREQPPRQI